MSADASQLLPDSQSGQITGLCSRTLYHATGPEGTTAIVLGPKWLFPGEIGPLGPAIYFSESPAEAYTWANDLGREASHIVTATVDLGRVFQPDVFLPFTQAALAGRDADSVKARKSPVSSWVYAVYNPDRIVIDSVDRLAPPPRPLIGGASRVIRDIQILTGGERSAEDVPKGYSLIPIDLCTGWRKTNSIYLAFALTDEPGNQIGDCCLYASTIPETKKLLTFTHNGQTAEYRQCFGEFNRGWRGEHVYLYVTSQTPEGKTPIAKLNATSDPVDPLKSEYLCWAETKIPAKVSQVRGVSPMHLSVNRA
jgi:hypothetical protein